MMDPHFVRACISTVALICAGALVVRAKNPAFVAMAYCLMAIGVVAMP